MFSLLFGAEARSETISSSDPGIAEWFGLGATTESGVSVTPASSMRLAAVYSCIHRLASSMAQVPGSGTAETLTVLKPEPFIETWP